jgi:hypothetical protein
MTPGTTLLILIWIGSVVAGYFVGKYKGQPGAGIGLTIILGLLGLIILACLPRTRAAKVAAAQRQYEIQAEAARRAGYPYPPQQPYAPYSPAPGQGPYAYPQPGQWQQPPPPGSWDQPPPSPWPGPQAQPPTG